MSALLRALSRRIRLAIHRHDPIECWCGLSADGLPLHRGPGICRCWARPGEPHDPCCGQVSLEQMRAFLRGRR